MCVSPEVDVIASAAIAVAAVDALRRVGHRRMLPLALLPAVFAVHTFSSALIWWGADGTVARSIGDAATWFFLFIAYVLLPIYIPISILLLERRGWRRDAMILLLGAGAMAAWIFLDALLSGGGSAVACDYYINFQVVGTPLYTGALYVVATCGAMLLSSHRALRRWGMLNAAAVSALMLWSKQGLPSLWCFWAACTSFFVAWFLREQQRDRQGSGSWPWQEAAGPAVVPPERAGDTGSR